MGRWAEHVPIWESIAEEFDLQIDRTFFRHRPKRMRGVYEGHAVSISLLGGDQDSNDSVRYQVDFSAPVGPADLKVSTDTQGRKGWEPWIQSPGSDIVMSLQADPAELKSWLTSSRRSALVQLLDIGGYLSRSTLEVHRSVPLFGRKNRVDGRDLDRSLIPKLVDLAKRLENDNDAASPPPPPPDE